MPHIIKVSHPNGASWEKTLTHDEFSAVKTYVKPGDGGSFLHGLCYPIRTQNLKDFSKDFFLPTTVNYAIKVQNIVSKIFAVLGALVLDICTFPIRCFTCYSTIRLHRNAEVHPFLAYLKQQGVPSKLLESNWVEVKLGREEISQNHFCKKKEQNGKYTYHYHSSLQWDQFPVTFIELPHSEYPLISKGWSELKDPIISWRES